MASVDDMTVVSRTGAEEFVTTDLLDLRSPPSHRGLVERLENDEIVGWCLDTRDCLSVVVLHIFLGDQQIGTVSTGISRPDVCQVLGIPVQPGFRFSLVDVKRENADLAFRLLAAQEAKELRTSGLLRVVISGQASALPFGTAFSFGHSQIELLLRRWQNVGTNLENVENGPRWRGFVDDQKDGEISGWCVDATSVEAPVELELCLGGHVVATTTTDIVRMDISQILGKPTRSGFRFTPGHLASAKLSQTLNMLLTAAQPDVDLSTFIAVQIKQTGQRLPMSPKLRFASEDARTLYFRAADRLRELSNNDRTRTLQQLDVGVRSPQGGNSQDVRIIAYYLPQFHPFAENDSWWGKGFTEWTNVTTARPYFSNHDQPRIPSDLGYYDLRLDEIQEQQVALAKRYGIAAFCYYYYSFAGKTLMTLPIDRHMASNYELDFCLCWANETWSRRWDGSESDTLIKQQHNESDDVAFIDQVIKYFAHERYIKIEGAPVLVVYRLSLLEKPAQTIASWKRTVKAAGFSDLHVCMAETFGLKDPHYYGADSSVQFPPHGVVAPRLEADELEDLAPGFSGAIHDYNEVVAYEIKRPDPGHLRFRCAMPSWDNTSRKHKAGNVFHRASPEGFEAWLSVLCAKAARDLPKDRRFVFVNAWNEWAEGAYLEPDRSNGHGNLRAVRAALSTRNMFLGEMLLQPALDEDIDELRARAFDVVSTLVNTNRQLLRFATEHAGFVNDRGLSPFILRQEEFVNRFIDRRKSILTVETINGQSAASSECTFLRDQRVSVRGWFRIPDVWISNDVPSFLCLFRTNDSSGAKDFVAAIYGKEQRSDVSSFFNDEGGLQWHGFNGLFDLHAVVPGAYQLGLLYGSSGENKTLFRVNSEVTIHVG